MSDQCISSSSPSTDRSIRVLKFGGTSVGTPGRLRDTVHVVRETARSCCPVVVVSAAAGVTDLLVEAADAAPHSSAAAATQRERIGGRYRALAQDTIGSERLRARYESNLQAQLSVLERMFGNPVPRRSAARDAVLAVGERLMVPLLVGILVDAGCRAQAVDAASLVRTDATHGAAVVDGPGTRAQIRHWWTQWDDGIPVVTGFVGSTGEGVTTTLGRGGSDYSAALLARGLEAGRMERWTDVEGLYTADPTKHDDAQRLSRLQMEKAQIWAKEGRLGLHARTLDPLSVAGIPVHVRCTHRPGAPGTRIVPSVSETPEASSV